MKSIVYIGMDVHKNSYSLCALNANTGEIVQETTISPDVDKIVKFINSAKEKIDEEDISVLTGYEAGCLGYSLYHQLTGLGIDCDILAPTTMSRSAKNIVQKNDRMDAHNIATNLNTKAYKKVYVPNDHDNQIKEYIRMRKAFCKQAKCLKQEINAYVLKHGERYSGKSRWTPAHIKWLKELELSPVYREILDEYLDGLEKLEERIERYTARIEEFSKEDTYKEKIGELCCLKGLATTSSMTVHVETSDFNRFSNAKSYAAYCGFGSMTNDSGDKHKTGMPINKQGNSILRTTFVEAAQVLVKGTPGKKGKKLKGKQMGQDVKVIAYADKAVIRLQKKFRSMIARGVNRNKAIVAVARELSCFVWGIETGNID